MSVGEPQRDDLGPVYNPMYPLSSPKLDPERPHVGPDASRKTPGDGSPASQSRSARPLHLQASGCEGLPWRRKLCLMLQLSLSKSTKGRNPDHVSQDLRTHKVLLT